jgi:ubiquinone/menaquinone biosynthesis C-methylase UbiE
MSGSGLSSSPTSVDAFVELVEIHAGKRVLDAASGAGAILFPAAEQVGPRGRVVGIDLAGSMVERLRQGIAHRGLPQAQAQIMDAQDLKFPNASFDFVLCGFALDVLPNPEEALSEFRRCCSTADGWACPFHPAGGGRVTSDGAGTRNFSGR